MSSALQVCGHTALVTGAGGGIGRACACQLAAAGVAVAAADTREQAARDVVNEIADDVQRRAYRLDVRDAGSVAQVFEQAWHRQGPVDVLVNAAGLYPSDPLLQMSPDAWHRVLGTNLTGPHLCVTEFARRLVAAHRPGVVVNISSGAAR